MKWKMTEHWKFSKRNGFSHKGIRMKKIVLAYSGGLDTSVILKWLIEKGHEVVCVVVDVGQNENLTDVKNKALLLGASKVYVEDLKKEFVEDFIFKALKSNAIYEGSYLLGTSMARPLIAKKQVEIAKLEKTNYLAHGATGKGNDQIRFELAYKVLLPSAIIISPWRDESFLEKFKGRIDLINYANDKKIPIDSSYEKPYSIDANLMHTSYEGGKLEDPAFETDDSFFMKTKSLKEASDCSDKISIEFKNGIPIKVENKEKNLVFNDSLEIFNYLNQLASIHGIGRIDIVENRFIGIKSRGLYETPGGTILWKAHRDLENLVLDKEVSHLKDMFALNIAKLIYNGFWFSPEMDFLMAAIEHSQRHVEGIVSLTLYKGNVIINGRDSKMSLYKKDLSSMDVLGGFNPADAQGFIKIQGLRLGSAKGSFNG